MGKVKKKTSKTNEKKVKDIAEEKANSNYIYVSNAYILNISAIDQETGQSPNPAVTEFTKPGVFPFQLQYKISRRLKAIRDEIPFYNEQRKEIVENYAEQEKVVEPKDGEEAPDPKFKKGKDNQYILPKDGEDGYDELTEELNELFQAEIEIPLPPIKLNKYLEKDDMPKLGDHVMALLMALCEDIDDG